MKKRPDITERTKANLITAFCKILENKKFDKITVKEITDQAGYYRSTFYQYFTDISDLMDYVENIFIEDIKKQTLYNLSNSSIDDLILNSVSFFDNDSQYLPILFGNNANPAFFSNLKIFCDLSYWNIIIWRQIIISRII